MEEEDPWLFESHPQAKQHEDIGLGHFKGHATSENGSDTTVTGNERLTDISSGHGPESRSSWPSVSYVSRRTGSHERLLDVHNSSLAGDVQSSPGPSLPSLREKEPETDIRINDYDHDHENVNENKHGIGATGTEHKHLNDLAWLRAWVKDSKRAGAGRSSPPPPLDREHDPLRSQTLPRTRRPLSMIAGTLSPSVAASIAAARARAMRR